MIIIIKYSITQSLSLFCCPFFEPIRHYFIGGELASFWPSSEDIHTLSWQFSCLLVDELIVSLQVSVELVLLKQMLVSDVEIFEKLGERLLDPFIFGVWKIEKLH